MANNATEVLVSGAGPTGLMLALELARRDVAVRIIDKLAHASSYSRALVVHARSLELFQNLGLEAEFLKLGFRTIGVSGYVEGRHIADLELGDIGAAATPFPFVLFISQADTERILEQALARHGVTVERGTSLVDLAPRADGVGYTLQRDDGAREIADCAYLAGCDGAHSVVRHKLGLAFEGAAYEQDFALADVHLEWALPRDRLMFFLGNPGVLAVFPMPSDVHRLIVTVPAGYVDTRQPLTLAETESLVRRLSAHAAKLSAPVWLARFQLHHRGVDRYGIGRVFVAGDAAHIHSPAGGQGMNTGIQDAANLAWKLALAIKGQASTRLLESYSAERWPIGQVLLKRTDRLFEVAATGNRWIILLRNFVVPRLLPLLARYAWLRKRAFRFVSQLGIHYRGSPVVVELGKWNGGPHAGARAPDAALRRGHVATTLFELLRGPEHHLLVFTGESATHAQTLRALVLDIPFPCQLIAIGTAELVDPDGAAHALYGARANGAAYLIRPDGYVGARAPLAVATEMLERYRREL